ncbi:class III signal peptide-containing protein [Candidatus Micrarchaeota archaeon]|nr:class III signal peptide-containing protein [Candidatus Micrarchaeota archaeon]
MKKGQLSAEMLILIVVILAILAIVATQLLNTAQKSSEKIESQSTAILEKTEKAVKGKEGSFCVNDDECLSGSCIDNTCS